VAIHRGTGRAPIGECPHRHGHHPLPKHFRFRVRLHWHQRSPKRAHQDASKANIPGVNVQAVLAAGATQVRQVVSAEGLQLTLDVYNRGFHCGDTTIGIEGICGVGDGLEER